MLGLLPADAFFCQLGRETSQRKSPVQLPLLRASDLSLRPTRRSFRLRCRVDVYWKPCGTLGLRSTASLAYLVPVSACLSVFTNLSLSRVHLWDMERGIPFSRTEPFDVSSGQKFATPPVTKGMACTTVKMAFQDGQIRQTNQDHPRPIDLSGDMNQQRHKTTVNARASGPIKGTPNSKLSFAPVVSTCIDPINSKTSSEGGTESQQRRNWEEGRKQKRQGWKEMEGS